MMGSDFDSFDQSPLGAFLESGLKARGIEKGQPSEVYIATETIIKNYDKVADSWDAITTTSFGESLQRRFTDIAKVVVYEGSLIVIGSGLFRWNRYWEDVTPITTDGGFAQPSSPFFLSVEEDVLYIAGGNDNVSLVAAVFKIDTLKNFSVNDRYIEAVDTATDTLTVRNNDYIVGDVVKFRGDDLPTGLNRGAGYFIKTVSGNDITVSSLSGGSTRSISSEGDNVHIYRGFTGAIRIGDLQNLSRFETISKVGNEIITSATVSTRTSPYYIDAGSWTEDESVALIHVGPLSIDTHYYLGWTESDEKPEFYKYQVGTSTKISGPGNNPNGKDADFALAVLPSEQYFSIDNKIYDSSFAEIATANNGNILALAGIQEEGQERLIMAGFQGSIDGKTNRVHRYQPEESETIVALGDQSQFVVDVHVADTQANHYELSITFGGFNDNDLFSSGETLVFDATAIDNDDGDISDSIVWFSDVDGVLGSGSSISTTLSDDDHRVTARILYEDLGYWGQSNSIRFVLSDPAVRIESPNEGEVFGSGEVIDFSGTATDSVDGDISTDIDWSSSIDGSLGTGASISTTLSDGTHTITASVDDSSSNTATADIDISVG